MPSLLALEWDDVEARIAIAEVRRGSVVLEQALAVPLPGYLTTGDGKTAGAGPMSMSGAHDLGALGRRINEALVARGVRRAKTLVAVGRANIELKNLTLPPAPADELPELVRFQAEKEFNTLGDDWPLDFIPIPGEADEALTVLAAAISPELVAEIEVTCEAANLTPQRLVLRPCAAASLLSRAKPGDEKRLRLLIDLLPEEADLTVLAGDSVVFMRTARLPVEALKADPLRVLLPEIRRTIAAVHARFHGRSVEEVYLCGEDSSQGVLAKDIGRELGLSTEVFNPLTACTLGDDLRRDMPEHPSRFAPLVGMLLDDAAGDANTIDFLNPRKKREPRNLRKQYTIAAAVVGGVLAIGLAWVWFALNSMDGEIEQLTSTSNQKEPLVKQSKELLDKAKQIDLWLGGEINWLDEIARVANKAPKSPDMMLTSLVIPFHESNKPSVIQLSGFLKDSTLQPTFVSSLRDDRHIISPKGSGESDKIARYKWQVSADVEVKPESAVQPASAKKGPAAGTPGATKVPKTESTSPAESKASPSTTEKPADKAPAEQSTTPQEGKAT
jgi:Tfp pilus assembly PilM family ATPase